jgi:hypothetical protein
LAGFVRMGAFARRALLLKVLADGDIKFKLLVRAQKFSKAAVEKITEAGGSVEVLRGLSIREHAGCHHQDCRASRRVFSSRSDCWPYIESVCSVAARRRSPQHDEADGLQQGGFLGLFNMFSGGAIENLSIFALGVMPYISASIIFQLLTVVVPTLDRLNKEGEQGRRKRSTSGLGTRRSSLNGSGLLHRDLSGEPESQVAAGQIVHNPGSFAFRGLTVLTLMAGTSFIMWLGEQITERGIGNGMSFIIFAGIVNGLPARCCRSKERCRARA